MYARVRKLSAVVAVIVAVFAVTIAKLGAWETKQSASVICNQDGHGVVAEANFTNDEPANRPDLDMKVTSVDLDGRLMNIVGSDIAKSGGGQVKARLVIEDVNSLPAGKVIFHLAWVDGHGQPDQHSTKTNSVEGCEDIPGVSMTVHDKIACGETSFFVDISAGEGTANVTPVLKADNNNVPVPPIQPNQTAVVSIPISAGQTIHLQLQDMNGKVIDQADVIALSANECAQTGGSLHQQFKCGVLVSSTLTIQRGGMTGDFTYVLFGKQPVVLVGDSVTFDDRTDVSWMVVYDSLHRQVNFAASATNETDHCEPQDHETAPPLLVDVCPKLTGNQSVMPANMQLDASGDCATIPPAQAKELPFTGLSAFSIFLIVLGILAVAGGWSLFGIKLVIFGHDRPTV